MNIRKNMKTNTCIVVLIFTLLTVKVFAQNDYKWGEWTTWGDQEMAPIVILSFLPITVTLIVFVWGMIIMLFLLPFNIPQVW